MKILDIKAMRGPNQWSIRPPELIVMRLDIEDLEQKPTDKIPGFFERLKSCSLALQPSLQRGHEGGFLRAGGARHLDGPS
jgi:cyanophycin synthetase